MEPIAFIHGYSAESKSASLNSVQGIYGTLPQDLRSRFPGQVIEIDLSRYVSLDDGVTIDDISQALQRALEFEHSELLDNGFNAIIHSTGALVLRNWIRRFSKRPSPLRRLIYLAGANFGSGWAHIGQGQLAKWGRLVFDGGSERGVQVLDALELGSDWTIDLHLSFLRDGNRLWEDFQVREAVIVGSQANVKWFEVPIRYAKEDGSDGVVRVSASNMNFHYLRFGPTTEALTLPWEKVSVQVRRQLLRKGERSAFYELKEQSRPGVEGRPEIPFAIPYQCAHSGPETGVVIGEAPRPQVLDLLTQCFSTPRGAVNSPVGEDPWPSLTASFHSATETTYAKALTSQAPSWWMKWLSEPRKQYDPHAQIIFRVRDQNGRPVEHFDIFFDSVQGRQDKSDAIKNLFEDKHLNGKTPNILVFYLRTATFSEEVKAWVPRLPGVNGCYLEISAMEPGTDLVVYLPMRFEFDATALEDWIVGHRTTIIDVELMRLPAPEVFQILPLP